MAMITDAQMGFDVTSTGFDDAKIQLQLLVPEVRKAMEMVIGADVQKIRDRARSLASGSVLKEQTGSYVKSIQSRGRSNPDGVFGKVTSDDRRAGLFEHGGSTPPRDILPNTRDTMRFLPSSRGLIATLLGTGEVYATVVHRPVVQYPPHPTIHAAFDEMKTQVEHDLRSGARSFVIDHGPV